MNPATVKVSKMLHSLRFIVYIILWHHFSSCSGGERVTLNIYEILGRFHYFVHYNVVLLV